MDQDAEDLHRLISRQDTAKLEALKALAGAIAHDYNNLLTGILGNLELLQRRAAKLGVAGFNDYLEGARGAANRAVRLNRKLAAVAGQQALNISAVSVTAMFEEVTPDIIKLLGGGLSLQIMPEETLWHPVCDENALLEAIFELAANAKDATPDGGTITITAGNITLDAHPEIRPGDYVVICVQDTGHGMTPEIAARALEPFFSTRQRGAVCGLGLAAVDTFVRKCGGAIKINDLATGGASIALYLPRSPD